jgi:hypothetical protein
MHELILEAGRTEQNYWRSLWRDHELFYFLAWRDILVRYKQTAIGITWAVLRPFLTMLVFTVVFHCIANLQAPGGLPYALFVFAAMLSWQFFATVLSEASASLLGTANLISQGSRRCLPTLRTTAWHATRDGSGRFRALAFADFRYAASALMVQWRVLYPCPRRRKGHGSVQCPDSARGAIPPTDRTG